MTTSTGTDTSIWLILKAGAGEFAVPARRVREMLQMPAWTPVPYVAPSVRGVANVRGRIYPIVDLRRRLGGESRLVEEGALTELIEARWNDHLQWVDKLGESLRTGAAFGLALDPNQCAFGRWRATFQTEWLGVRSVLHRIDRPHRELHRRGAEALELQRQGRGDEALRVHAVIQREVLPMLRTLFEEFREALAAYRREIAIVLETGANDIALCVDAVIGVDRLTPEPLPEQCRHGLFAASARRTAESTSEILLCPQENLPALIPRAGIAGSSR